MNQDKLQKLINDTFLPKKAETKQQPAHQHLITVELAVQNKWGGHRFTFTKTTKTISYFEAQLAAKEAAARAGLDVWWVVDRYEGKPRKD